MTDSMAQTSLGLPPSSRHDIISALLNAYGNSFEGGDNSPYTLSPVPSFKELPPPPPPEEEREYSNEKPLPPVGHMSMRFQLRVDEPASPESPDGSRSSLDNPPTKIVSKRLNRSSKPPSLRLTISNGSTATLPSAPTLASQPNAQTPTDKPALEEKSLPPPPPPGKSERRQQPSPMGNQNSKERPPRKDSLQSQDGSSDGAQVVKRKPLAKFTSLADLGNGPRGGKGGPLPQPRKQSLGERSSEERPVTAIRNEIKDVPPRETGSPDNARSNDQPASQQMPRIVNELPPTPNDEPSPGLLPPSKKPFGGIGLPSNPKHRKGKSSTGFDMLKGASSPRPQLAAPGTITPGPTPPLDNMDQMQQSSVNQDQQLSEEVPVMVKDQSRPFSFEPAPPSPQKPAEEEPGSTAALPTDVVSPIEPPITKPTFPPRSASRAPPAFASLPPQQRSAIPEESESSPVSPDTPPFVPLTVEPAHSTAPPINEKHHNCYSKHATFVWSRNTFQPMPCMICHNNDQERKWACVWCQLRVCVDCSRELTRTPGRNLKAVIEKRGANLVKTGSGKEQKHDSGNPALVVWDADAEDLGDRMDFS